MKRPLAWVLLQYLNVHGVERLSRRFLRNVRFLLDVQLSGRELSMILRQMERQRPCRFLCFGVGNDSRLWTSFNKDGVSVFLEDNEYWRNRVARECRSIDIVGVKYGTKRRDYLKLVSNPGSLSMELPDVVTNQDWDIILVDGPAGARGDHPGRMQSIYMASRLVKNQGYVFVHDMNRPVETLYSGMYLGEDNIVGRVGRLACFQIHHPVSQGMSGSSAA